MTIASPDTANSNSLQPSPCGVHALEQIAEALVSSELVDAERETAALAAEVAEWRARAQYMEAAAEARCSRCAGLT